LTRDENRGSTASVLLIDRSEDCREVLSTALRRRGFTTYQARGARDGVALARMHRPQLIVLDVEETTPEDASSFEQLGDGSTPASMVLLGTASGDVRSLAHAERVAKPFRYGPLVARIEELLASPTTHVAS